MSHQDLVPELLIRSEIQQLQLEGVEIDPKTISEAELELSKENYEAALAILDPYYKNWDDERTVYERDLEQKVSDTAEVYISSQELYDRIFGAWLGRCTGCLLGKPVEGWLHDKIKNYLVIANEYPLKSYLPKLVPYPKGLELHKNAEKTTRGNVSGMVRDDDIDYTILGLIILEEFGLSFTTEDIASTWLKRLPVQSVFTAEAIAYRNLINGFKANQAAGYRNPYRHWIGAQIRSDMWGYVNHGKPAAAAEMAFRDARLSHTGDGVYGEVWAAACIAQAFKSDSVEEVILEGLKYIPEDSGLSIAIKETLHWSKEKNADWESVWQNINQKYSHYPVVHVLQNTCVIVMALMMGGKDFGESVCIGVMGGWDTDCTAATIGSILGAMLGKDRLPNEWTDQLNDRCFSAIAGVHECQISDLVNRTLKIISG